MRKRRIDLRAYRALVKIFTGALSFSGEEVGKHISVAAERFNYRLQKDQLQLADAILERIEFWESLLEEYYASQETQTI